MGIDKEDIFLILTQYGIIELGGLKYHDWKVIRENQNVFRLVEQLASENKRLETENNQLKERLETHKITIPIEVKIRFVDGC